MKNPGVRTAFALATNREGYVTALGGASAADAAYSLIGPAVPGHRTDDVGRRWPDGRHRHGARDARRSPAARCRCRSAWPTARRRPPTRRWPRWSTAGRRPGSPSSSSRSRRTTSPTISEPGRIRAAPTSSGPTGHRPGPPPRPSSRRCSRAASTSATAAPDATSAPSPTRASTRRSRRIATLKDPAQQGEAWSRLDASLVERVAYIALAQRRSLYLAGSGGDRPVGQRGARRASSTSPPWVWNSVGWHRDPRARALRPRPPGRRDPHHRAHHGPPRPRRPPRPRPHLHAG